MTPPERGRYGGLPSRIVTERENVVTPTGREFVRMWVDAPNMRLCIDWSHDELQKLAEILYRRATGIDIRDAADLAALGTNGVGTEVMEPSRAWPPPPPDAE